MTLETIDGQINQCTIVDGDGFAPLHEKVPFFYAGIVFVDFLLFPELKIVDPSLRGCSGDSRIEFFFNLVSFPDKLLNVVPFFSGVIHGDEMVERQVEEPSVGALRVEGPKFFLIDIRRGFDLLSIQMTLSFFQMSCSKTTRKKNRGEY